MKVIGQFNHGTIIISNFAVDDDKYHIKFDIDIATSYFKFQYHLGEVAYHNLFDLFNGKETKICDETAINNHIEITKDYFGITVDQDGVVSNINVNFDIQKEQDKLFEFMLEFKAVCEVLFGK